MSSIIPFDFSAPVTSPKRRDKSINAEALTGAGGGFPVISIKGKVFALVRGDERTVVTRVVDGEVEPAPALNLVVVRANPKARVFYAKAYAEGDSEGAKPTCFSQDGQRPDATVEHPQAQACQACPHAAWGSKVSPDGQGGKGTACTVNTRLAVVDPKAPEMQPMLLRVPAGSRANFNDAVKTVDSHGRDYNEVVMRVSFDQEAPSPRLVFKPTGIVADVTYDLIKGMYDTDSVREIVGVATVPMANEVRAEQVAARAIQQARAPVVVEAEVAAALAAPAPTPTPAPAPAPAPKAAEKAPKAAAKPTAAKPTPEAAGLMAELSGLLGATDD
jgi:hypothetical protein